MGRKAGRQPPLLTHTGGEYQPLRPLLSYVQMPITASLHEPARRLNLFTFQMAACFPCSRDEGRKDR